MYCYWFTIYFKKRGIKNNGLGNKLKSYAKFMPKMMTKRFQNDAMEYYRIVE